MSNAQKLNQEEEHCFRSYPPHPTSRHDRCTCTEFSVGIFGIEPKCPVHDVEKRA